MPTNNQIKKLIREVIAEGIDLDIPDAEIERVVDARLASVTKRLDTLEKTNVAAANSSKTQHSRRQSSPRRFSPSTAKPPSL